jgi:23S rRNA (pseudouridine1915-N3)-methyltransferase
MRIRLIAVGRLKDGPERRLVDDYLARAGKLGANLGWRAIEEVEVADGGGRDAEGARLLARLDAGHGQVVRLDERGENIASADLALRLSRWREAGVEVAFIIGGADGASPEVVKAAPQAISFGRATWPHRLVRVMLAEQIYRALSISAGSPYHRE